MKESLTKKNSIDSKPENKALPDDYWFSVIQKIYERTGEKPSPLQLRAQAIITALRLPSGQTSALETDTDGNRIAPEKDKVVAEFLTNKAGVIIDEDTGIVSMDPRDIYPGGLPTELEEALDPKTAGIINLMYKSEASTRERFGDTEDQLKSERPFNYFRLPGGVDLFLIGYVHDKDWHANHQGFLSKIGTYNPAVISIEGISNSSPGASLSLLWKNICAQQKHYDKLMKQLIENGFTGLFTEIDMRDESIINMDSTQKFILQGLTFGNNIFPSLPEEFFNKYFAYIKREQPQLANILSSPEGLKDALKKQATVHKNMDKGKEQYKEGKWHYGSPYLKEDSGVSTIPTGLELGQLLFTDSLDAIKLFMTAKLMTDGYISKGPIVDFKGAAHLPNKSFFLHNPEYAMEIVLRTINELMVGEVREKNKVKRIIEFVLRTTNKLMSREVERNIKKIYEVFDNPNWTDVVKEIAKLYFAKVDTEQGNSVEIGNKQYPINKVLLDFFEIYDIDPTKVIPSDEEIQAIMQKIA